MTFIKRLQLMGMKDSKESDSHGNRGSVLTGCRYIYSNTEQPVINTTISLGKETAMVEIKIQGGM